jgi:CPA2 family monovalent cation:H+ antiporter-2
MGLVVGIERKGRRILNPESTEVIEKDDLLWIVGDEKGKKQIIRHGEGELSQA